MFYFRDMAHIIATIKQRRNKRKMVSCNALQNRCLHATTLVGAKHFNNTPTEGRTPIITHAIQ